MDSDSEIGESPDHADDGRGAGSGDVVRLSPGKRTLVEVEQLRMGLGPMPNGLDAEHDAVGKRTLVEVEQLQMGPRSIPDEIAAPDAGTAAPAVSAFPFEAEVFMLLRRIAGADLQQVRGAPAAPSAPRASTSAMPRGSRAGHGGAPNRVGPPALADINDQRATPIAERDREVEQVDGPALAQCSSTLEHATTPVSARPTAWRAGATPMPSSIARTAR